MHTIAARKVGTTAEQVKIWMRKDVVFRRLVEGIHEHKKDFFESSLINLVRQGDSAATVFANRTQNRDRGYSEKVTVDINTKTTHEHAITVDDLSPEVLRAILDAKRKKIEQLADNRGVEEAEIVEDE
jgi:hypothetical protein